MRNSRRDLFPQQNSKAIQRELGSRIASLPLTNGYPKAFSPASAICSSSWDCTPDTPMAPTHSFWCMIGSAP